MRRREFIAGLGSAAAWPLAARAQQAVVPVIGYINSGAPEGNARILSAFRQGFAETGFMEGRNVIIEYRWGHDQWERLRGIPRGDVIGLHLGLQYSSSLLKRSCDVIGSLLFMVMLFPLFVLVAILIKLDSPGPVFFRHRRVGKDGDHFVLWKFRSMRTDVPEYEVSPRSVADDRLTRIGRLIRRLSIDEMPQLINVLKGEMSLVGPRPEMPFIVASYRPTDCERLIARPGVTGLWQISPARAFPIHENLQYDLHYIRNQNFWLDCVIILRTITAVIQGVGAV